MTKLATKTVGMDLGDKYSHICVLDADGEVVETTRVATTERAIGGFFQLQRPMRVVLEVGTHSPWISRLATAAGHEVIVANPRRVRLIAENKHKNDETDAELLARLGRVDPKLLAPIQHRTEDTQHALVQIRARASLVEARTKLVNSVRGLVKATGHRLPRCATDRFGKLTDLIPEEIREALSPIMQSIQSMTDQIRLYDKEIERCAKEDPNTQGMRQIAGVSFLTALTFVLTLEDPTRFANARAVGPFLGLTPRQRQSGDSDPEMRISKCGDEYLRKLVIQASHYILGPFGPDTELRAWGLRLAARGGKKAKKRAAVAVARRLAVTMMALWKTGADYEPFPNRDNVSQAA